LSDFRLAGSQLDLEAFRHLHALDGFFRGKPLPLDRIGRQGSNTE
jgi:hypothetical protein